MTPGKKIPVLDQGHVILLDTMGNDQDIVDVARTAYQKGTSRVSDDRKLIRYLMRHRHSSPFESAVIKIHVKVPIFVERQWARHRTAGWNEVSARYSVLPEEFYVPDEKDVASQSNVNKQGRGCGLSGPEAEHFLSGTLGMGRHSFEQYHQDLENGISRELARINLPLSTYTEKVWWINLHNLFHFLSLRMDSHAQWEIRQYANAIAGIVKEWVPMAWEAFEDYRLNGMFLTGPEIEELEMYLTLGRVSGNIKGREFAEFVQKIKRLGLRIP